MYIDAYDIWTSVVHDNMDDDDIVDLWNAYCIRNNYSDDEIYPFDEYTINEFMEGMTPYEILMYGKDIDPNATYFQWEVHFNTFYSCDFEDYIDFHALFKNMTDEWSGDFSFYSSYCSRIAELCGISNEDSIEYDFDEFIRDEYVVVEVPDETEEIIKDWEAYKKECNED